MLYHHVAHGADWSLLFRDHQEARDLWRRLVSAVPGLVALCIMPDHVHVLARYDAAVPFRRALGHYAQWRNHRRGERSPVFAPPAPVEQVKEGQKGRRVERYVQLNPCRGRLVDSPLRWPWSSYRDAVGLALDPVRPRARYPERYHAHHALDTTVDDGPLPTSARVDLADPQVALPALRGAVSALTRTPLEDLGGRGPARTLLMRSARVLTPLSCIEIAGWLGVDRGTVHRVSADLTADVRLVERVAGDPRLPGLGPLNVRALERWRREKGARVRRKVLAERHTR